MNLTQQKVSVLIRCKNEERWIGHAIQSVLDFLPDAEILILNNKSSDDSLKIAREFMSFDNIRIIDIDHYTPGRALNIGAQEARHDLILILSAHCVLTHIDLPSVSKHLEVHKAVFGKQIPIYHGKKITPRYLWANFINEPKVNLFSESEGRQFLHNAMCFYNKTFLLEQPFDEELVGKEDRYWAIKLVEIGKSYYYDPQSLICHHHWTPEGNTWKGVG